MATNKDIKKHVKGIDRTRIHPNFPPSDNPIYPPGGVAAGGPNPDQQIDANLNMPY